MQDYTVELLVDLQGDHPWHLAVHSIRAPDPQAAIEDAISFIWRGLSPDTQPRLVGMAAWPEGWLRRRLELWSQEGAQGIWAEIVSL